MRYHGMSHLLEQTSGGVTFRKMLVDTVLATDMSVHVDFMRRFEEMVAIGRGPDTDVGSRRVLLCQALIKCADISNPVRGLFFSRSWSATLTVLAESTAPGVAILGECADGGVVVPGVVGATSAAAGNGEAERGRGGGGAGPGIFHQRVCKTAAGGDGASDTG